MSKTQFPISKKTNCGALLVDCIDCYESLKPWCLKCNNIELRKRILQLEAENLFLKKEYDDQFKLTSHLIDKYIRQHLTAQPFTVKPSTHFFTITFDPSRFKNLGTNTHLEEQYILHQLSFFIKDQYIHDMYGSFELTKEGVTHSHINIDTYQPVELKRKLKERFTFNMSNNKAIHSGPANAGSMAYINKKEVGKGCENKTYFTLRDIPEYPEIPIVHPIISIEKLNNNYCNW